MMFRISFTALIVALLGAMLWSQWSDMNTEKWLAFVALAVLLLGNVWIML